MLLWFVGLSVVGVWAVLRDPSVDYRLVAAAALAPDLVDAAQGGPRWLHALVAPVVVMAAVMVGTRGRRPLRRRLLALPIGLLCHLVLDGAWARTSLFWWPFFGAGFPAGGLPSLDRPVPAVLVQEVVGAAVLAWAWRRFGLSERSRRLSLLRTGQLVAAADRGPETR